jgi:hypothetical protein
METESSPAPRSTFSTEEGTPVARKKSDPPPVSTERLIVPLYIKKLPLVPKRDQYRLQLVVVHLYVQTVESKYFLNSPHIQVEGVNLGVGNLVLFPGMMRIAFLVIRYQNRELAIEHPKCTLGMELADPHRSTALPR